MIKSRILGLDMQENYGSLSSSSCAFCITAYAECSIQLLGIYIYEALVSQMIETSFMSSADEHTTMQ